MENLTAPPWLGDVVDGLLTARLGKPLLALLEELDLLPCLGVSRARRLIGLLRQQGYLQDAVDVGAHVRGDDRIRRRTDALAAELRVLRGEVEASPRPPSRDFEVVPGRVLLVTGTSLPEVDSTATRRSHAWGAVGPQLGLDVHLVTPPGVGGDGERYVTDTIDGVAYHRTPGPGRGAVPLDRWLMLAVERIASVVRKVRPAALVATSDYLNGTIALRIGSAYGIPVVYEIRGMWEDSWLERQRDRFGWQPDELPQRWGMPDAWQLRRDRETEVVRSADAVVVARRGLLDDRAYLGLGGEKTYLVETVETHGIELLRALESLGVRDRGAAEIASLNSENVTVGAVRTILLRAEPRRLERTTVTGVRGRPADIRDRGWVLGSLSPVAMDLPFDWVAACRDHRSQAFHLHAWDFMVPFLREWEERGDEDALRWALDRAVSWCSTFTIGDAQGTMAWYDMALALRAPRLGYLLDQAVRAGSEESKIAVLAAAVVRHQQEIFAPRAFNPRTNHGFFTAAGQVAFARRLRGLAGMHAVEQLGQQRLEAVVTTQFASDGGHLEHSPDYHRMLLESFEDAIDDGIVVDEVTVVRIRRASAVMSWLSRPDGTVVQIGDSPATPTTGDRPQPAPVPPSALPSQRRDRRSSPSLLVLPETGYVVVRAPLAEGHPELDSYLTLMGAFHSRAHKHCDDLSVTWSDVGHEILIDSGRYGYLDQLPPDSPDRAQGFFYGRPERQYVERTLAHNTAQLDALDHERRERRPYGSAIVDAYMSAGEFCAEGQVDHDLWTHRRRVILSPGRSLTIRDDIEVRDRGEHLIRLWWNLPGELSLSAGEPPDGHRRFDTAAGDSITVSPKSVPLAVTAVRGQEQPLRGWRSRVDYEFEPAWSVEHVHAVSGHVSLTTVVELHMGETGAGAAWQEEQT